MRYYSGQAADKKLEFYNLVSVLIGSRDSLVDEEIKKCFEIEEGYFSNAGEEHEWIISLLNRVKFYMQDSEKNGIILQEKYKKAEEIFVD